MKAGIALLCCSLALACERSTKPVEPPPPAAVAASQPPPDAPSAADAVATEVRAAMAAYLEYASGVIGIMRDHGSDCDAAAKLLAGRVATLAELGPRMMKVKSSMQALPEADRERLKHEADQMMAAFQQQHTDAEVLEQRAKHCEQTSPAFADIAPKVMFVRKK